MPTKHTALLLPLALILLISGCHEKKAEQINGYIEGRLTMSSSPSVGRITNIYVKRGQSVKIGQPLYAINPKEQHYNVGESEAALAAAIAKLRDLQQGKRAPKVDEIHAKINQAKANIAYAKVQMQRNKKLLKTNSVAQQAFDSAQKELEVNVAILHQNQAMLANAKQAARPHIIMQAKAEVKQAKVNLQEARWHLKRLQVLAYTSGFVFDTYHRIGERINANQAVLSIQNPHDIRALFYVPETQLAKIHLGENVTIHCANCNRVHATINYISPNAEFTPPVIYSRQTNSKLVYRIEAGFDHVMAKKMHPGQPISVTLGG